MNPQEQVRDNPGKMRYEIPLGEDFAVMEYRYHEGNIALMHTVVPQEHEGRGYAGALAKFALEKARHDGIKVLPYCPYVSAYIVRHPEYQPLVQSGSTT